MLKTKAFGLVLVLDGAIQCTERDEFSYHEMIAHLPATGLARAPKKALVVGGGDGGVLRELCRYPSLERLDIAEIDGRVIEVSKRYFPKIAAGYEDARVSVHVCDGIEFVKNSPADEYDVIVVDSSDPVGPAAVLFERPFFEAMHRALAPGGFICTQGESQWYHLDVIQTLAGMCKEVFVGGSVNYAYTTIPTYPSGQIGFMICGKAETDGSLPDPRTPKRDVPNDDTLQYYSPKVHQAAFALPRFAEKALADKLVN